MDQYLQTQQTRLREVFDRIDANRDRTLDRHEIGRLVRELLQEECTDGELAYVTLVLLGSAEARVSFDDFLVAIKASVEASNVVKANRALERLTAMRDFVAGHSAEVNNALGAAAHRYRGFLPLSELEPALASVMRRKLQPEESRLLVSLIHEYDLSHVTTHDLLVALQLMRVSVRPLARTGPRFASAHRRQSMPAALDGRSAGSSPPLTSSPSPLRRQSSYNPYEAPAASAATAARASVSKLEWRLEEVVVEGLPFLLDAESGKVFSAESPWPTPVGLLTSQGGFRERAAKNNFFDALNSFLKDKQARLQEVFNAFDDDHSGTLDNQEIAKMVVEMMAGATAGDQSHVQLLLLGTDNKALAQSLSFPDVLKAIRDSIDAKKAVEGHVTPNVFPALAAVADAVALALPQVQKRFLSSRLSTRDIVSLVQEVHRGFNMGELRYLLAALHQQDVTTTHTASLVELLAILRLVIVVRLPPTRGALLRASADYSTARNTPGTRTPLSDPYAAPSPSGLPDWTLEAITIEGQVYYLDPATTKVFRSDEATWPQPIGSLTSAGTYRARTAVEFFQALDE